MCDENKDPAAAPANPMATPVAPAAEEGAEAPTPDAADGEASAAPEQPAQ